VRDRDQHRHGKLPLEAQRDVQRDDDQRGDDRPDRVLGHRLAEAGTDRLRARVVGEPEPVAQHVLDPVELVLVELLRVDLDDVAAQLAVVDGLDLRLAEPQRRHRIVHLLDGGRALQRRGDSRPVLEVDPEVQALDRDRQRADQQDRARDREEPP
jgi:hypothetical protein